VLLILVDGGYLYRTRQQHVGVAGGIADLVDSLPGSERLQLDLRRQHFELVIVEQREQRNVPQAFDIAGHGSPHVRPFTIPECLKSDTPRFTRSNDVTWP